MIEDGNILCSIHDMVHQNSDLIIIPKIARLALSI